MNHLEVKNLTLKIGDKTICNHLDFATHPGEIWGLLGPNGCGKTTFLHALAGIHPFSEGEIILCQKKLAEFSLKEIAQWIGLLFQDFNETFPQTVYDYCLTSRYPHLPYFKRESERDKEIVKKALQLVELDAIEQRLIKHLSGGEKKRLAIAAILAQTPFVYLLDEPINHLDIKHQLSVLKIFFKLAKKNSASVIMSLHDVNWAYSFCDYIILMFPDGEIIKGKTNLVMTSQNLTRLYQHAMIHTSANGVSFWHAPTEA